MLPKWELELLEKATDRERAEYLIGKPTKDAIFRATMLAKFHAQWYENATNISLRISRKEYEKRMIDCDIRNSIFQMSTRYSRCIDNILEDIQAEHQRLDDEEIAALKVILGYVYLNQIITDIESQIITE